MTLTTTTPAHGQQLVEATNYTHEQVALLKRTICQGATDDELQLFVSVCEQRRLNPFAGQIHFVKRSQWNGALNNGEGGYEKVGAHQTGIDGYRLIAERTSRYGGPAGTWWCGPDRKWVDVWLSDTPPSAAKVVIVRTDFAQPVEAVARWTAYVQTKKSGQPNSMWSRMGAEQLAKCAEALALRKAFPEELGGLYTHEEMGQASNPVEPAERPAPNHSTQTSAVQATPTTVTVNSSGVRLGESGAAHPADTPTDGVALAGGPAASPVGDTLNALETFKGICGDLELSPNDAKDYLVGLGEDWSDLNVAGWSRAIGRGWDAARLDEAQTALRAQFGPDGAAHTDGGAQ